MSDPIKCDRVLIMWNGDFDDNTNLSRHRKTTNTTAFGCWDDYDPSLTVETEEWTDWWCTHGSWEATITGKGLRIQHTRKKRTFKEAFYYDYMHFDDFMRGRKNDYPDNHFTGILQTYYNLMENNRRYLVI